MSKSMLIDAAHSEETRVVVVGQNGLEEFDFESASLRTLKGNIYLAKVTRVEPSLQAAFVSYGGNRHGFLPFNEIHPDYYRIPVADREALAAAAAADRADRLDVDDDDEPDEPRAPRNRSDDDDADDETNVEDQDASAASDEPGESEASAASDDVEDAEASAAEADDDDEEAGAEAEEAQADAADTSDDDDGEDAPAAEQKPRRRQRRRSEPRRQYKIQEVVKRGQIMLVQVSKEERGGKGAAMTTYISLAGRYCVLMPNTGKGGGISRKITDAKDRKRLKGLISDLDLPDGMAVIVRTAGVQRTKAEIKRDHEFLLRLWEEIRERTFQAIAPALIYEEASLVKRAIRDLYARDVDEVLVEGDAAYREAKHFMRSLMPSHAKRVQPYKESTPLFQARKIEGRLESLFNPVVRLPSGGYLVINQTEALVAIDVNSGRSTRERNIEETALKTNLEAAVEAARQLRLRELAGIVVIDFIDMEERRNNQAVERKLKDALKTDRARVHVGRMSSLGLVELSRQRLRPSMFETSFHECPHCAGLGRVRSVESNALGLLRAAEDVATNAGEGAEISVTAATDAIVYIMNHKRDAIQRIEDGYGVRIVFTRDDAMAAHERTAEVITEGEAGGDGQRGDGQRGDGQRGDNQRGDGQRGDGQRGDGQRGERKGRGDSERKDRGDGERKERGGRRGRSRQRDEDEDDRAAAEAPDADSARDDNDEDGGRRRRRGRRGGRRRGRSGDDASPETNQEEAAETREEAETAPETAPEAASDDDGEEKSGRRRRRRRRGRRSDADQTESEQGGAEEAGAEETGEAEAGETTDAVAKDATSDDQPEDQSPAPADVTSEAVATAPEAAIDGGDAAEPKPEAGDAAEKKARPEADAPSEADAEASEPEAVAADSEQETAATAETEAEPEPEPQPEPEPEEPQGPPRTGWWRRLRT